MDPWVVARVGAELERDWRGAWVQGAWASPDWGAVVRLRAPGRTGLLMLAAGPRAVGVGLVERRPTAPPRPPALAAYLRAHAVGGRLEGVRWGRFDRVLELAFRRGDGGCSLVWEAAGRHPLLAVLDPDGRVRAVQAVRPRPGLSPGRPYEPPPVPEGRVFPDRADPWELERRVGRGEPLERILFGVTPGQARELRARMDRKGAAVAFKEILAAYGRPGPLWEYEDGLSAVEREGAAPVAVWPSALEGAGRWLEVRVAGPGAPAEGDAPDARRWRRRVERRIRNIEQDLARLPDPAGLRRLADALAAGLHRVARGTDTVVLPDPWGGGEVEVPLDPARSPADNLERLYRRAAKAERAREVLTERLAAARAELEGAAADGGPPPAAPPRPDPGGRPFARYVSSDGWPIWVGRNGRENDRLLREARPWDLWLHARDAPGAHVLIRKPGREARCPDRTLREAAGLAALRSRRSGEGAVEVMVVEAGRVRKPKGAGPGRVVVHGEETVRVRPGWGSPKPAMK
ncbi:NFACT RNA binding domain-containing protein [Deferrisoma camini]|uniref:NFACT RNA binding domain-containing protein n=1 Tax=Deferrisoma camini TaxID=1035120 RepID=UPI00046C9A13|nr:NFACT RNA binding domain-containing protein [Deferrisoma camini]